jgi:hypothetical protein
MKSVNELLWAVEEENELQRISNENELKANCGGGGGGCGCCCCINTNRCGL